MWRRKVKTNAIPKVIELLPQLLCVLACILRISVCVHHGRKQAIPLFQSRELPQASKHNSIIVISPDTSSTTLVAGCLLKNFWFASVSFTTYKHPLVKYHVIYPITGKWHWPDCASQLLQTGIMSFLIEQQCPKKQNIDSDTVSNCVPLQVWKAF